MRGIKGKDFKIVEKSWNTRQLKLCEVLRRDFLDKVKGYTAVRMFDRLFYKPGASEGYDNLLTPWRYYISMNGAGVFCRINFCFTSKDWGGDELRFEIKEKSIPGIVAGLDEHEARVRKWIESENTDHDAYDYAVKDELRKHFNREFTSRQFASAKRSYAAMLRRLAVMVENLNEEPGQ